MARLLRGAAAERATPRPPGGEKTIPAFRAEHEMNDKQFSTGIKITSLRLNHKAPIKDLDDK